MKGMIEQRGMAMVILFMLTSVPVIPLTSPIVKGRPLNDTVGIGNERLQYTLSFESPTLGMTLSADARCTNIEMPGCLGLASQPGNPLLPVRFIQLLLPPMEVVDTVTVTGTPVELTNAGLDLTNKPVVPSQPEVPMGSSEVPGFTLNRQAYSSDTLYPGSSSGAYHVGYARGYAILAIPLFPVQIIPAEGRLFYYPEMTVTVSLRATGNVNPFYRDAPEDEAWVKNLVNNPEITSRYVGLQTTGYPGGLCDPSDHYDYVIIATTQNSLDHWDTSETTPYNWESLMNEHEAEGLSCTLVTVQDINACPDYYNATPLFNDTQAHIREFCKDAYQDWGTQYVLIGGDAQYIPARLMDYSYETNVDSDLYWSNLDNTFNADQDTHWGEEDDAGFDLYTELYIGRIPCDVPQDVSNWLTKSFTYANATSQEYLENGGFYAGDTGGMTQTDDVIDFAAIKGTDHWLGPYPDQWPGWLGFLFGFETWNALFPDDAFNLSVRWTYNDPNPGWNQGDAVVAFRDAINNDSVTLITGVGHADSQMSLDVYKEDWATLYHNTMPFFIIDLGCHVGDFDDGDDGVLDTMLFSSDTALAFGCLFATGYTWESSTCTNASDALQTKLFWDYFFDLANNSGSPANWQLGKALAYSKDTMAPTINWTGGSAPGTWRGTIEDRLLFADPAQRLKSPHQNSPPALTTIRWSTDTGLTLSATDPDGDNVFYMIDWGDGPTSGWLGPFPSGVEENFTHNWAAPGTYFIKVKAKDVFGAETDWSEPLQVDVQADEMTIAIQGGVRITVTINNTGGEELSDVTCTVGLDGGFILLGRTKNGDADVLAVGKSTEVNDFVFGIGRTTITVNATCAQGMTARETANAFVVGFFVIIIKNT